MQLQKSSAGSDEKLKIKYMWPYLQSYPPSSLTSFSSNDLQFLNFRLDAAENNLSSLEERVAFLEGLSYYDKSTSAPTGISEEKMKTITMILSDKVIGWKAAFRKYWW